MAVLACDMPYLTTATFRRLRDAAVGRDGAALVGPDGRRQLAMVLEVDRLDAVRPGLEEQHNLPCTGCWRPSTWPRSPPRGVSTATWTPGPTCAT